MSLQSREMRGLGKENKYKTHGKMSGVILDDDNTANTLLNARHYSKLNNPRK